MRCSSSTHHDAWFTAGARSTIRQLATEPESRVTWEIEPAGDGTCALTVVHDHLGGAPRTPASISGFGWAGVISGLKTLLETGRPMRG